MAGPLDGVRVLDLTLAMAGPAATQRLADLGASVIKVEPPGTGDFTRSYPIADVWLDGGTTTSFLALNRAKRSVTVNLKKPGGREVFRRLATRCEILIQNFRPGVTERLGVGDADLREANPRLVYVSISGYGATGPLRDHPGQDLLAQAFSGMTWNAGREGDPPVVAPAFVADAIASHLAVEAALAGLYEAGRTGRGRAVEVSLLAGLLDMQAQELVTYMASGRSGTRTAEPLAHTMLAPPYGVYPTATGYVAIAMADLPTLAAAIGTAELGGDRDAVFRAVTARLLTASAEDWVERLIAHGLWAGPVLSYETMLTHPQVVASGLVTAVAHPDAGEVRLIGSPFSFAGGNGAEPPAAPPRLGQHTVEVLREAGYSQSEIEALFADGAL
jgi:crotonobetainyl-CoA:carnitine CoA-transferase CaiB-like acyl-CoA transferase